MFANERLASIAFQVLAVDREPKRSRVTKDITFSGNAIDVKFSAPTVKSLRTSMNGFLDYLILCQDTIKRFDPSSNNSASEEIKSDAGTHASADAT